MTEVRTTVCAHIDRDGATVESRVVHDCPTMLGIGPTRVTVVLCALCTGYMIATLLQLENRGIAT